MMNVKELRQELIRLGLSESQAEAIKGKQNLINKIEELKDSPELDFSELDNPLETSKDHSKKDTQAPERGTKEWTDYVISHCYPNELKQGCPTCDGLRRLTEKFVGEIIHQGVVTQQTFLGELCSTVVYEVQIIPFAEMEYLNIHNLPTKKYREVADAHKHNTKNEFAVHPSATASTRAEGRCYRKALKLTVLTAEELDNDKDPNEAIENIYGRKEQEIEEYLAENITSAQISLIESRSKNLDIDIQDLLKYEFGDQYIDLNQLSRGDGTKLATLVNKFQQKGIPKNFKQ